MRHYRKYYLGLTQCGLCTVFRSALRPLFFLQPRASVTQASAFRPVIEAAAVAHMYSLLRVGKGFKPADLHTERVSWQPEHFRRHLLTQISVIILQSVQQRLVAVPCCEELHVIVEPAGKLTPDFSSCKPGDRR
ncbi:hypothetical protein D3C73_1332630 [compost metagenome]